MKRLIWLPVAGFLLVAGAAVAAAAPGLAETAGDLLANQDSGTQSSEIHFRIGGEGSLLDEVLDELVSSGVLTQEQADAVTSALTAKGEQRRAEMEAQREQMEEMWTQIKTFLEDGVITADEISQLPADNPFSNVEEILADGQITLEELESVGPFGGFFDGPGRGHHRGPGGPGWLKQVPDAAPDGATDSEDNSDSGANS